MSAVVDGYNASSCTWTTAQLSSGRYSLAAASLDRWGLAIIGGGVSYVGPSTAVVGHIASGREWTTAQLLVVRYNLAAALLDDWRVVMIARG